MSKPTIRQTAKLPEQSLMHEDWPLTAPIRFEPALEAEFRARRERLGLRRRLMLGGAILACLLTLLMCSCTVPTAPPALARLSQRLLCGLMIPCTALSILCCAWRPLRRWSIPTWVLSSLVNIGSVMFLRVAFARGGYDIIPPAQLLALLLALNVSLIPQSWQVPSSLLALAGGIGVELWAFGVDAGALLQTGTIVVIALVAQVLRYEFEKLLRINWYREHHFDQLAGTDALTGLGNRRHFDATLRKRIRAAAREGRSLALTLLDVDHFKSYNDHYGHPAGDRCLEIIGRHLRAAVRRPHDFAARLGGEEFAIVWFDAGPDDAVSLSETLRRGIAGLGIAPAPGVVVGGGGVERRSRCPPGWCRCRPRSRKCRPSTSRST